MAPWTNADVCLSGNTVRTLRSCVLQTGEACETQPGRHEFNFIHFPQTSCGQAQTSDLNHALCVARSQTNTMGFLINTGGLALKI